MARTGCPKEAGLGIQQGTGQYREIVNGRSLCFGTDPDEALARYPFYKKTGLIWKRGYRQFCRGEDGTTIPMNGNIEAARRKLAVQQAIEAAAEPLSVGNVQFSVNTVRHVGGCVRGMADQPEEKPPSCPRQ